MITLTDFDVDMARAYELLNQICHNGGTVAPIPSIMSTTLDCALALVRNDFPDHAAELLAAWRDENTAVAA